MRRCFDTPELGACSLRERLTARYRSYPARLIVADDEDLDVAVVSLSVCRRVRCCLRPEHESGSLRWCSDRVRTAVQGEPALSRHSSCDPDRRTGKGG